MPESSRHLFQRPVNPAFSKRPGLCDVTRAIPQHQRSGAIPDRCAALLSPFFPPRTGFHLAGVRISFSSSTTHAVSTSRYCETSIHEICGQDLTQPASFLSPEHAAEPRPEWGWRRKLSCRFQRYSRSADTTRIHESRLHRTRT